MDEPGVTGENHGPASIQCCKKSGDTTIGVILSHKEGQTVQWSSQWFEYTKGYSEVVNLIIDNTNLLLIGREVRFNESVIG
jgi:hypothetical protein